MPKKDQPKDIKLQLCNLVSKYICNPNSIILAVTCETDIENSVSLELAKEVDPEGAVLLLIVNLRYVNTGERTLTVHTKLDLMPAHTDLHKYLNKKGTVFNILLKCIYC